MGVNYGVLRGKVVDAIPYKSGADHFQVEVQADQLYRIAIDVYSQFAGAHKHFKQGGSNTLDTDRMVMYYKDENYKHPVTNAILKVATGFTAKANLDSALYLDYVRFDPVLFPIAEMKVVAPQSNDNPAGDNLNGDISPWIDKAMNNDNAEIFAFGSGWDDNAAGSHPETRSYFNPDPSVGIHDVHMNQGDKGQEAHYNGVGQDGALFIYYKDLQQWIAMFFRFQVQSIDTDQNGNAL